MFGRVHIFQLDLGLCGATLQKFQRVAGLFANSAEWSLRVDFQPEIEGGCWGEEGVLRVFV